MSNFAAVKLLRSAASVARVHTRRTIHKQTVGEHTFGVMALMLYVESSPSTNLVRAIMYHDVPESITGDTPSPIKAKYPSLKAMLDQIEQDVLKRYDLDTVLTTYEEKLLAFCDVMELAMFACEEVDMGNTMMAVVLRRALAFITNHKIYTVNAVATELHYFMTSRADRYPPNLGESVLHHEDLGT